jgi:tetratricopeptide (TPR) repeat protein
LAAFTRESLPQSKDFYEQAIAVDSGFAEAHSRLGMALVSVVFPGITAAHEAMPLANAAARRALDLDPASAEAHAVLGMVAALYDSDWNEAKRRFQLALSREPVPSYVRWYYSYSYLLPMSRTQEAVQQCVLGLQDDPLNFLGGFHFSCALLAGGDAETGEAQIRQLSAVHSNMYQPYYLLALSQAVRGLRQEAITAAEKAYSLAPWSTTTRGLFAGLLKYGGQLSAADRLRNGFLPANQYGAAMGLALFHLGCSEIEQAAQWAERATEQRDTRMVVLIALVRAFWPSVFRSDSRWSVIARTLEIPSEVLEG